MARTHYKDDAGADHIVKDVNLLNTLGKFYVRFTCCAETLCVTPEEFAMSYSVQPDPEDPDN